MSRLKNMKNFIKMKVISEVKEKKLFNNRDHSLILTKYLEKFWKNLFMSRQETS